MIEILIFDPKYIETANCLYDRTKLPISKGDWKPEPKSVYIVYGAQKQTELLIKAKQAFNLTYLIVNGLDNINKWSNEYTHLCKTNIVLEPIFDNLTVLKKMNIPAEYFLNEYYYYKPKSHKPIDFLYQKTKSLDYLFKNNPEVKNFQADFDELDYTIKQKTDFHILSKTVIVWKKNDWDSINKAISCGCKVVSNTVSTDMMEMYKPYVVFINLDEVKDITEILELLDQHNFKSMEEYNKTLIMYSINKYMDLIKNVLIQAQGEKKEITIPSEQITIDTSGNETETD